MTTDTPFVTADGAAEILGIHRNEVYALIDAGKLPAARISKPWTLRRQDCIDYLNAEIDRQTRERRENKGTQGSAASMPTIKRRRRADAFAGAGT